MGLEWNGYLKYFDPDDCCESIARSIIVDLFHSWSVQTAERELYCLC